MSDGTKTCSRCKQAKSIGEFGRNEYTPDGFRYQCRPCVRVQNAESRRRKIATRRAAEVPQFEITVEEPPTVVGTLLEEPGWVKEIPGTWEPLIGAPYKTPVVLEPTTSPWPDPLRTYEKLREEFVVPPAADLKRILIIPDTHVPYEDKRAWNLMLQVARSWKPHKIIILGDFGDFYSVSSHDKRPDRVRLLDVEVEAINDRLTELDALGATEKYFISGNHEDRLERYLTQKAPELFNLVRVKDLFKLNERGWKYTPYKASLKVGKVNFTHDCGNAGGQAHAKALGSFQHNVVIGHTHRMAVSYEGNAEGESHVGAMFGWLGDVNDIDYMHKVSALRAWQLGFGLGWQEASGVTHLAPVPVVGYRCVVEGKLYIG